MNELQIVYLHPSELKPYENNTRSHTTSDIEAIKKSILEDGFNDPIGIWSDQNIIVEGHGRQIASLELKLDRVPCVRLDHLTDKQRKEYAIRHNRTAELSQWDFGKLEKECAQLSIEGQDFPELNFSFDGMDEASADEQQTEEVDTPDDVPHRAKKGDVWILGEHRLMCGDSTNRGDVAKLIDGERVNMVFTDPPYGYEYQSNMRTKTEKFDVIENDDKILNFFPLLSGIVSGFVMVCTTWKVLDKWLPLFKRYFELSNMIVWDKGGGYIGDLKHTFGTDYEVILCSNNGAEIQQKRIGSVWSIGKDNETEYKHPTQKPVALSGEAITHTTKPGETVLDLFGGSGSTLLACEQTGRKCFMMELDEHYVDVIIARWEKLTGQTAELLKGVD